MMGWIYVPVETFGLYIDILRNESPVFAQIYGDNPDWNTISTSEEFKLFDVIVLSGSQRKLGEPGIFEAYMNEVEFLRRTEKPVLGICFGHQLLCMTYGEDIVQMDKKLDGYYMVRRDQEDEIFEGLGEKFLVMESHEEMITKVPYDFLKLADSPTCPIEVVKHHILPQYGVQFHPERFDDKHPAGSVILENFFKLGSWFIK